MKLDKTNWQILSLLQENARLSYADIGKQVGLTAPAVAERMRKMEEVGIITGYHAHVDTDALGLTLVGLVSIQNTKMNAEPIEHLARHLPEVVSCDAVTGQNNYILRVVATTRTHLHTILGSFLAYGMTTSSVVLSRPVTFKPISMKACRVELES